MEMFTVPAEVPFLGEMVSSEEIWVNENKVQVVLDWPVPTTHYLESFLGFTNHHRDFIQGYAQLAAPLYQLTGSKSEFVWCHEQQEAFDNLKQALTSTPVLAFPTPDDHFILNTEASEDCIFRCCTFHHAWSGSHFGWDKTLQQLQHSFFWHQISLDTQLYVQTCATCNRNKKQNGTPRAELESYTAGYPGEIDWVGV